MNGDAAHSTCGTTSCSIETSFNAASEIISINNRDATIAYTRDNLDRWSLSAQLNKVFFVNNGRTY